MDKYKVEIKEELSKIVEIEADSYNEALSIARGQYKLGEIILDDSDYKGFDIRPYN